MARFIMVYLGGDHPDTPEEGQAQFAKYMQWLENLADAVISPANPLKNTQTVHSDGSLSEGSQMNMSGYTLVEASTLEDALQMAASCPFLEINGRMEVSEVIEMPTFK